MTQRTLPSTVIWDPLRILFEMSNRNEVVVMTTKEETAYEEWLPSEEGITMNGIQAVSLELFWAMTKSCCNKNTEKWNHKYVISCCILSICWVSNSEFYFACNEYNKPFLFIWIFIVCDIIHSFPWNSFSDSCGDMYVVSKLSYLFTLLLKCEHAMSYGLVY